MGADDIDDATLAAFLENRLGPAERDRVLRAMADSQELRVRVEDAAYLYEQLGAGEAGRIDPVRRRRRGPWLVLIPVLAAAVLAAVVFRARWSAAQPAVIGIGQAVVIGASTGDRALIAAWGSSWDEASFTVTRGADDDRSPAFQIGARIVQLEVARRAGDATSVRKIAGATAPLLARLPLGGPVSARLSELARAPLSPDTHLTDLAAAARAATDDRSSFDLGGWTEALRLSTLGRDGASIQAVRSNPAAGRLTASFQGRLPAAVARQVDRVNQELSGPRLDPGTIRVLLDSLSLLATR